MGIGDPPGFFYQEHAGRAQHKEFLNLHIAGTDNGAFIGQDGVRHGMFADILFDHFGAIGHHHQHFCVQGLEFWIVMAQLRHMIGAVQSGKADIENQ